MSLCTRNCALIVIIFIAVIAHLVSSQLSSANESINKDRAARQSLLRTSKSKPKFGFFGTIFHLILEQINDTKSAYNQVSDLVNGQFRPENAVTRPPGTVINGTTESPKITRTEFLKILDRNLKGLARLRNLEWREAKKDSRANLQGYWNELFRKSNSRKAR